MNAPMKPKDALRGPLETETFPEQLSARVVEPGPSPRVHGYEVEADLALFYRASDLTLLSLTGELPASFASAAFEVACMFLAPISVAEAPVHAAVLARLCAAPSSSIAAVAAIALSQQARELVVEHEPLLAWLRTGKGELPVRYRSEDQEQVESVARLSRALSAREFSHPVLAQRPTRFAALVSVLFACGLEQPAQLEAVILLARLPSTLAEGLAEKPTNFAGYPINLPAYVYEEVP
jgi:hypothetical protein